MPEPWGLYLSFFLSTPIEWGRNVGWACICWPQTSDRMVGGGTEVKDSGMPVGHAAVPSGSLALITAQHMLSSRSDSGIPSQFLADSGRILKCYLSIPQHVSRAQWLLRIHALKGLPVLSMPLFYLGLLISWELSKGSIMCLTLSLVHDSQ